MITVDLTDWDRYNALTADRMRRCEDLPGELTQQVFARIKEFIEQELVVADPRISYEEQVRYYKEHGEGMFGRGTAPVEPWKVGAQEKMGGVSRPGKPDSAHFLASMGISVDSQGGRHEMAITTQATMTPYDPTAGGERPIMVYLREGWQGTRARMRRRLGSPGMEVARFIQEAGLVPDLARPILAWIIRGGL